MKYLTIAFYLCFALLPRDAFAGLKDYMNVYNIPNSNFAFGTWAYGDGGQSLTATFCVASSNYRNAYSNPPPVVSPPAVHEPYDFKVTDRAGPAGYFMYLDRNESNIGNARLSVQVEHRDLLSGNTWVTLSDGVYGNHAHNGQFRNCKSGKNSQIRISILTTELEQARAGPYRVKLTATGRGGSSGTALDSDNFRADITVANIVRITGLADVGLGTYSAFGDVNVEEAFCVYSNSDSAAYNLSVSSPNQDGSNNFYLKTSDLSGSIPYSLYFKSNITAGLGAQVLGAPLPGNGNNSSSNCGGANNAKISVKVLSTAMSGASTGSYKDTLTVLIAPI
jgi:hypothetical protein